MSRIITVIFCKDKWNITQARKWLKNHDYKSTGKVEKTANCFRFRISNKRNIVRFRNIRFGKNIVALIGFKKGEKVNG